MEELLISMALKYPLAVAILGVVGGLRIVFKPIMGKLVELADYTDSPKDNELLQKIMSSKAYGSLVWLLDLTASIKLPPKTQKDAGV